MSLCPGLLRSDRLHFHHDKENFLPDRSKYLSKLRQWSLPILKALFGLSSPDKRNMRKELKIKLLLCSWLRSFIFNHCFILFFKGIDPPYNSIEVSKVDKSLSIFIRIKCR